MDDDGREVVFVGMVDPVDASANRDVDPDELRLEARLHVVDGLRRALGSLAEINAVAHDATDARAALDALTREPFGFSAAQARYVLDMPLRRQTMSERAKLDAEAADLRARIGH